MSSNAIHFDRLKSRRLIPLAGHSFFPVSQRLFLLLLLDHYRIHLPLVRIIIILSTVDSPKPAVLPGIKSSVCAPFQRPAASDPKPKLKGGSSAGVRISTSSSARYATRLLEGSIEQRTPQERHFEKESSRLLSLPLLLLAVSKNNWALAQHSAGSINIDL